MDKLQKAVLIFVLGITFLLSGFLIPSLKILDFLFGLSYYVLDLLGIWKPGPSWIIANRFLSIFCFLIFPLIVSFSLSTILTLIADKLWSFSKQSCILFIIIIFILMYCFHHSDYNGISFAGHWTSNY